MKCIACCIARALLGGVLVRVAAFADVAALPHAAPVELHNAQASSKQKGPVESTSHHDQLGDHRRSGPSEMQKVIEQMARRADRLADSNEVAAAEVDGELEDIEASLAARAGHDLALANEIRTFRADLCATQGFSSHERADCDLFMRQSCIPDEAAADGVSDQAVQLLPEDVCRHFFLARATLGAPAPDARGPAPSPMAYHAQAPMPAPGPSGAGRPPWYSKSLRTLPEQGFHGDLVDHEDGETQTDDWLEEFGPNSGHRSYRAICRDHPDSVWCRLHLHYDGPDMPSGWERSSLRSQESKAHGKASSSQGVLTVLSSGVLLLPALAPHRM